MRNVASVMIEQAYFETCSCGAEIIIIYIQYTVYNKMLALGSDAQVVLVLV